MRSILFIFFDVQTTSYLFDFDNPISKLPMILNISDNLTTTTVFADLVNSHINISQGMGPCNRQ